MPLSVVIVLWDMEMQSATIPLNSRGQGHLVTFAKDLLDGMF